MREKIRMWEFTQDGKLRGVVGIDHPMRQKTIETSRIIGVRVGIDGCTLIETKGGSEYQLDGSSRLDLIREANEPKE